MIALALGFVIGFLTSVPIGPINLAVMMKGLSNRTGQGFMIGAGSGFMDIVYCAAAMFGISSLITSPDVEYVFKVVSLGIFFFFGVRTTFFRIPQSKVTANEDVPGFKRYFLLGIMLYLSNPSFIAYWITVAGIMHGYRILVPTTYNNLLFAIGTGVGTTGWFFTLLELVEKQKMKFDNGKIEKVTRGFGVVLLLISCFMAYQIFMY